MLSPDRNQLGVSRRRRRSSPGTAIEQRDLAQRVPRLHDVEEDLAAIRRTGTDTNLAADHRIQGIPGIALAEDDLAAPVAAPDRKFRDALERRGRKAAEQGAALEHDFPCQRRHATSRYRVRIENA